MRSLWSDDDAAAAVTRYGAEFGEDLALRTYTSRLIGGDRQLVLHGGGNTSLKGELRDRFGDPHDVLFIKASGHDLADIEPAGHVAVDLAHVRRLRTLSALSDEEMVDELRAQLFDPRAPTPSIETPVHALLPGKFADHSHADAILALTNQPDGEVRLREALGDEVIVLPYLLAGFELALQVAAACEARPEATAMVWCKHGIATWGSNARASYERMIELVTRAEAALDAKRSRSFGANSPTPVEQAQQRLARVAPLVRGLLAAPSGRADRPVRHVVLRPLVDADALSFVDAPGARELACSPPLTADHLIRTKPLPAWIDAPDYDDEERLRSQLADAFAAYAAEYDAYLERNRERMPAGVEPFDSLPRVVLLPGLGVLCAGHEAAAARIARDITAQTLAAKRRIAESGARYEGLEEEHLFDMEYRLLQHQKLARGEVAPLAGLVALVTGAAGPIGSAICDGLARDGAHVAVTDLAGPNLDSLVAELEPKYPDRVMDVAIDVTDPASVDAGFDAVNRAWGGVDIVVIAAGIAHVASLDELELEDFRRLERVNSEGTLLLLKRASSQLKRQGTGGDIVLVSTKNVFAPGARFGAYSATKAAAHQLARIASLELAEYDVRVNMVAPDAVFSRGTRPSALWAEVGPDRMRARNLDPEGLEEYYRNRNLLKARVEADHVANAVLFFVTRKTPTTGVTLPVDGGLADATPR
jgi:rhamnose utilization protein RhaD (predicted bifunctional aldolase and dehydrogenase)/NAD(P)-dependent dehydrogenase (short-subunit alcohol dehydrogenase family)